MSIEIFQDKTYIYRGECTIFMSRYDTAFEYLLFLKEYDLLDEIFQYVPNNVYPFCFEQWMYIFNKNPKIARECLPPSKKCEDALIDAGLQIWFYFGEQKKSKQINENMSLHGTYFQYGDDRIYWTSMWTPVDYLFTYGTFQDVLDFDKIDSIFMTNYPNEYQFIISGPNVKEKTDWANSFERIRRASDYDILLRNGYHGQVILTEDDEYIYPYFEHKYGLIKTEGIWHTRHITKNANS